MQRHATGGTAALRFRVAGVVLLVLHLTAVWWFTLRPNAVPWVDAANLRPLTTIRAEFGDDPWAALRYAVESLFVLAPAGVLLPLIGGRVDASPVGSFVRTVFAGSMLALVVELLKTTVPGQVANVDTMLLYILGVALAHLAVVPAVRARLRRHPAGRAAGAAHAEKAAGTEAAGTEAAERTADGKAQGTTPRITRVEIAP
ncbi:VanZ family protein [Streptomyces sp. WAC 06738]|uniref:VanZ family protein n=1 Tax=Streptomyces sp. WAC 06738 TaxID=2203210 RepID=UPI000F720DF5|nr:VanZ family protein [Streptomyces sp. WAC 06738]AZM48285.1 VanZ family protein [Streptomyces sp. WAC 06738]